MSGLGAPKALVFDLDGTLVDTLDDITAALDEAFLAAGLERKSAAQVKPRVGWGMRNLVASLLPESARSDAQVDSLTEKTMEAYARAPVVRTRPYDGVEEALSDLRALGIDLAVLSNKPQKLVDAVIAILFPGEIFKAVRGFQNAFKPKPDPAQCLDILSCLGVAPSEAVFVGDSAVDIETSRAAGLPVIACLWGFRAEEELRAAKPDYIAVRPSDIISIVKRLN
jgi:phosphoglycolate phosphatase